MKNQPGMAGNHAPQPPHSTEKTCYQGRQGVTPTRTPKLAFPNINEGGLWPMAASQGPGYTGINGREPTANEKGIPSQQGSMGRVNNGFD